MITGSPTLNDGAVERFESCRAGEEERTERCGLRVVAVWVLWSNDLDLGDRLRSNTAKMETAGTYIRAG